LARSIELNYMGVVCGYQDQYMATFGGLNYMDFRDKEFYREVMSEPFATVESLTQHVEELPFILANTGVAHHSGAVHKPIRERWLEGDRDVVEAYVALLARGQPGETYNIARGEGITLAELFQRIAGLLGAAVEPFPDPSLLRPQDIPYLVGDASKLKAATGWSPTITLERTLRDMVDAQTN